MSITPPVGNVMIVFPSGLILITVDSVFSGDGRLALRTEGCDVTRIEQRDAVNAPARGTGK